MKPQLILSCLSVLVITACGGSDDDFEPAPPVIPPTAEVPASASQTEAGLFAYLGALFKADADALEPVDVSTFAPVLREDTEPAEIS